MKLVVQEQVAEYETALSEMLAVTACCGKAGVGPNTQVILETAQHCGAALAVIFDDNVTSISSAP